MTLERIHTDDAPAAIGPYSQAIRTGGMLYVSGQIPLDPKTMEITGSDARSQAQLVMKNLAAVVAAGGSTMDNIVRCTIFLADMADFAAVNEVYQAALGEHRPARACVAVKELPKSVLVEVDCIAAVP